MKAIQGGLAVLAGALCLAVPATAENLVKNGGFEDTEGGRDGDLAPGWFYFTSKDRVFGVSTEDRRQGTQSLKFWAQASPQASAGVAQKMVVKPGKSYRFRVYVRNSGKVPLGKTINGALGIEWHNADGREIHRSESRAWDISLSRIRWEQIELKAEAPEDAATAVFAIYIRDGEKGGEGQFYLDDVEIVGPETESASVASNEQGKN